MTTLHKLLTALCSLIIVLASVLTLVFYFSFKPASGGSTIPINIEDTIIFVGEESEIQYSLLVSNAKVEFSTSDEDIAIVNNNLIVAKKVGVTLLNAIVTYADSSFTAFSQIKVIEKNNDNSSNNDDKDDDKDPDGSGDKVPGVSDDPGIVIKRLYHKITPIQNCKYENSTLYINETACFVLELYINLAQTILFDYKEVDIIVPDGVKVERELNSYILSAKNDGFIYLVFTEKGYNITINFELIKNT